MSSVKEHCSLCGPTCPECRHPTTLHARNGACHGGERCLCGWARTMGPHARPAPSVDRRRNKGVRIGHNRRRDLLRIPCYFCGGLATTIDHLLARSKGGTNGFDNLVSACALCNTMKSDKSYDELIEFCRKLETAITNKKGLKGIERFRLFKEQARKILEWHAKRTSARSSRGPEYLLA